MVQEEWPCLIDAIKAERLTSSPYVVFVMAQKTHNLRMFDPNGERGNVRMGTVLTSHSGVTAADCTDMYMVAHRALQGTAKPLRYVLVKHGWANPSIKDPPPFNLTERKCISFCHLISIFVLCRVVGEGVESVAHDERTRAEVVHATRTNQVCAFGG
jgi:hypothetical protein